MSFSPDPINMRCERCGYDFVIYERDLYRRPDSYTFCKSCRAKPQREVSYGGDYCLPWHGDYDLDDNPIKDGELYRPGKRSCGHSDCVRPVHVISAA